MKDVYIIGVGQIRFMKQREETVRSMADRATTLALLDAGLDKNDIGAVYFANSLWGLHEGQHCLRGQVAMRTAGIDRVPVVNVESACAGGAVALHLACVAVAAGLHDVVLAVGSEKMGWEDRAKLRAVFAAGTDARQLEDRLREFRGLFPPSAPFPGSPPDGAGETSVFLEMYAALARWHMHAYGTTREHLAAVAAKNHLHGSLNPRAQYQRAMSVGEVLADREVVYPLTRPMCSPLGDGAAAVAVCSGATLSRLGSARPVRVLASVHGQGSERELTGEDLCRRLGRRAYEEAGLGPADIDVAELHDATAYGELRQTETLGFWPDGEGGPFAASGATTLGGRIPVNPSGGMECRGHPVAATGLAQIHEIVTQLRHEAGRRQVENARVGLAVNLGGILGWEEATGCVHVLARGT